MPSSDFYKRVKIAGLISFIPFILAAAPLSAYFAGEYLKDRFGLPGFVTFLSIALGLLVAIREIFRIIKQVIKIERGP